ncbi:APC family permease [Spiroplasma endosymbiont of Panorpa germanica]|uniref:APC family permease n=1 Tax=Spiroplasma endosymbiont of Panorpa germanica TaxID=3066314 RepID=UPI0030CD1360
MKKDTRMGLPTLIWLGFSFIAGITFTASFATIVGSNNSEAAKGVGIHILWIFAIEGLVAFVCAWAFARLIKVHPTANGGASQYVRTAFGDFWGLFMGLINYAVIPLVAMGLLVTMVRNNFGTGSVIQLFGENGLWGSWGKLYLDLISLGIYSVAAAILFFGIRKYKIVANVIGYMTWSITILIMVVGIIVFSGNGFSGLEFYSNPDNIDLTFFNFNNAFVSCFFAFCGLESFITVGNNIKNRGKNMPIAMTIIMIATTIFYIVFTLILMGAVNAGFEENPNIQVFGQSSPFLKAFGGWIVILCTILMRFNSNLQVTLFGGSALEPMATQGFLPEKISTKNKENVPVAGVITSISIVGITFVLFMLIPDIIEGATGNSSPFDYATIAAATSIMLISVYLMVLGTVLIQGMRKRIKTTWYENTGWIIALAFLVLQFFMYFFDRIRQLVKGINSTGVSDILGAIIPIIYFVGVIGAIFAIYFLYYKPKRDKWLTTPQGVAKLEEINLNFRILNEEEIQAVMIEEKKLDDYWLEINNQRKKEKKKQ